MTIYRGFEIVETANGFVVSNGDPEVTYDAAKFAGFYASEDAAMDAVDAYKRALRAS